MGLSGYVNDLFKEIEHVVGSDLSPPSHNHERSTKIQAHGEGTCLGAFIVDCVSWRDVAVEYNW